MSAKGVVEFDIVDKNFDNVGWLASIVSATTLPPTRSPTWPDTQQQQHTIYNRDKDHKPTPEYI